MRDGCMPLRSKKTADSLKDEVRRKEERGREEEVTREMNGRGLVQTSDTTRA